MYPDEPFEEFEEDDLLEHASEQQKLIKSTPAPASPKTTLYSPLDEEENREGSHHHIQSVAQGPSLHIEQPLDSYLRDSRKVVHKSQSFYASEKVLRSGHDEDVPLVTLKDQPFWTQVLSPSYFRALIVFFATSYTTNLYVASISTDVSLELLRWV